MKYSYPIWSILFCGLLLSACQVQNDEPVEITGSAMGSTYSISIVSLPAPLELRRVEQQIAQILDEINRSMSTYLPDSELSRINQSSSSEWIPVSLPLYEVLAEAQRVSTLTQGKFDITVGPLVNLWGFGPEPDKQTIPDKDAIEAARHRVGYQQLELRASPPAIKKHSPLAWIDLSGIASGYAADRVAELLDADHIDRYLVNISGEMRARGTNTHDEAWQIGIEKPLINRQDVQTVIPLLNTGLTTAGDYRNFFVHNGKRYSHTIDPATGWPIAHALASVTVVHDSAMTADALDTALMVMGPDMAYEFAERENIAALFIIAESDNFIVKQSGRLATILVK